MSASLLQHFRYLLRLFLLKSSRLQEPYKAVLARDIVIWTLSRMLQVLRSDCTVLRPCLLTHHYHPIMMYLLDSEGMNWWPRTSVMGAVNGPSSCMGDISEPLKNASSVSAIHSTT